MLALVAIGPSLLSVATWSLAPARAQATSDYDRAMQNYLAGEYDEALRGFERAYGQDPAPILLYNIAQCQWKLGRRQQAAKTYRRYLDAEPKATKRTMIERRIALATRTARATTPRESPAAAARSAPEHVSQPVAGEESSVEGTAVDVDLSVLPHFSAYLGQGSLNPWGLGLLVRGCLAVTNGLGFALFVDLNWGESESALGVERSAHGHVFGVEASYDIFVLKELVVRPALGFGLHVLSTTSSDVEGDKMDITEEDVMLIPMVSVLHPFDQLYAGGQLRLQLLFDREVQTGLGVGVLVGMRL